MQLSPLIAVGPTKAVTFSHIPVRHGCSTRLGGLSEPPFDSLNMGFSVADEPQAVWENRRRFAVLLGVESLPSLLSMSHGKEVAVVDEPPAQPSDLTRSFPAVYRADAAITRLSGVPLTLTVADCVPVFFYDPQVGCIGLAHAGWRGTVAGIVAETIASMRRTFDSKPENIRVGIGPSIGPQAFEVGPEVADEFLRAFPRSLEVVSSIEGSHQALVDLWRANAVMALNAGVPDSNIVVSGWCTFSHPELFFSHRRDKGKTGRLLAGIIL